MKMPSSPRVALFIQATEPGAYPPLINAAHIMAEAGWQVTFLAAPVAGKRLSVTPGPGIQVIDVAVRPSHVLSKKAYLAYCRKAVVLARQLRPSVVYASDPTGALPGWLAAKFSGARLVYHEHDSPSAESDLHPVIRWARHWAAKAAEIVIFPNAERGRIAQETIGFDAGKLQIVWNVPRLRELPVIPKKKDAPLLLYYHGNISSNLVPENLLQAVASFDGKVLLHLIGYEAPGAKGYVNTILNKWNSNDAIIVKYFGMIPRNSLLDYAAKCHIGLALMPKNSDEFNLRNLAGASNKAFDYMASGLALIVSDMPEWQKMYVDQGFGLACDPDSVQSIISTISLYMENPSKIEIFSNSGRKKIIQDWNYENVFKKIRF